jgi:HK97 family phage major capsid protein
MAITPTVRHLYVAAKSKGYTGPDSEPETIKRWCADRKGSDGKPEPLETLLIEETEFEIASLAFDSPPVTKKGLMARVVMQEEDRDDLEAKQKALMDKAVDDRLKSMGIDPNKGKRIQGLDVGSVKSGEEREYEARIRFKSAVFSNYDYAFGYGNDIRHKGLIALGRTAEAAELYNKTATYLTQKGYTLVNTGTGQALSPVGFDADLHQLIRQFGVTRRAARVVNMNSDQVLRPKATGDLTVYYPEDGVAGTESQKTFTNVRLQAKKGIVITKMSKSLVADAAINVADDAGRDVVRAVSKQEDNTLFNANGTGSANGYIPQCNGILSIIGTGGASAATAFVQTTETSSNSRVFKSTATTPLGVTLSDVVALMSRVGQFVGLNPAFHCTSEVADAIFTRLAASVGGIQPMEIQGLGTVMRFLGKPIIVNNVMTTSLDTGSNKQLVVYGDLSLAADFGDRLGLQTEISDQRYWDEDNFGLKGTVRHDINVHELGSTSSAGPVSVLIQS